MRGRTDVCGVRRFWGEVGSAWSAPVRSPETWLEEGRLSFWVQKAKAKIRTAGTRTALLAPAGYLRVRFSLWGCRDVL